MYHTNEYKIMFAIKSKLLLTLGITLLLTSCADPCSVIWTEGELNPETGKAVHTMEIQNPPAGTDWMIWFSQFRAPMTMEEDSQGTIEHVSGTLYIIRPTADTKGESLILKYSSRVLAAQCRAPEAFYIKVGNAEPKEIRFSHNFLPAEDVRSFEYSHVETAVEDMIPQLKNVQHLEGTAVINPDAEPVMVEGQKPGWYRITVSDETKIEASDSDGAYYAANTIARLIENAGGCEVPAMVIEDWPDLQHRGVMLDVSRNFTRKEGVLKLIDLLDRYKVNVLHLHFGDDEGWRIEIDGLPELTSYGAFRALPSLNVDGTISEPDALQITYSASRGKDDAEAAGNGYYSHSDFVEILRYAKAHHIDVIPEFDTPGHSRAAIKSMEKRAELTGDISCMLSEPEDTSYYCSVQDYYDNAINVALPSTYTFTEKVFDAIINMYKEADARLLAIHVGGDEVPEGAWTGSPACQRLMDENGWTGVAELKDYYVRRILEIAKAKGVKIAGWQDLCMNLSPETFELMKENLYGTNFWTVSHGQQELGYKLANSGLDVVVGSAPNAYLDFAYNYDKKERGHNWGGYLDERRSFSLLPFDIYRSVRWDDHGQMADISNADEGKTSLAPEAKPRIIGIQGQLWSETIRSFDHVTYYIFPKALGLFERGWNAEPSWMSTRVSDDPAFTDAFNKFYSIIVDHEMPYYDQIGISYHKN